MPDTMPFAIAKKCADMWAKKTGQECAVFFSEGEGGGFDWDIIEAVKKMTAEVLPEDIVYTTGDYPTGEDLIREQLARVYERDYIYEQVRVYPRWWYQWPGGYQVHVRSIRELTKEMDKLVKKVVKLIGIRVFVCSVGECHVDYWLHGKDSELVGHIQQDISIPSDEYSTLAGFVRDLMCGDGCDVRPTMLYPGWYAEIEL